MFHVDGQSIFSELRRQILNCEFAPGEAIFEQKLAASFGVSKSPIREALLRLQEQNLVEVRPRSGYRVRLISATEVNEMYEMRLLYERACVKAAIARASDQDIDKLARHLTTDAHMFAFDWIGLNRAFHAELALISGNSLLASATNKLTDQFDRFTRLSVTRLPQPVDFSRFNNEHAAIVASIRSRNKKAAIALVRTHIEASRQRTIQTLTESDAGEP
jgi:DNA-binding GntR family transcriptional regulator